MSKNRLKHLQKIKLNFKPLILDMPIHYPTLKTIFKRK